MLLVFYVVNLVDVCVLNSLLKNSILNYRRFKPWTSYAVNLVDVCVLNSLSKNNLLLLTWLIKQILLVSSYYCWSIYLWVIAIVDQAMNFTSWILDVIHFCGLMHSWCRPFCGLVHPEFFIEEHLELTRSIHVAYFDFSNCGNHLWRSRETVSLFFQQKVKPNHCVSFFLANELKQIICDMTE